ncbi:MAG: hypothetical protein K9N47_07190 [Prosthecobacter sp.]|uniref:hypothetical protein n=1 Tax=Prosthecobacter sp. TaxID=1965333 RepID=UPI0025E21A15|nr:hypothetical protein [Prosthecobacter sp.]MCF7785889.1 hypothetical protein [Prosthecobacter sp.]
MKLTPDFSLSLLATTLVLCLLHPASAPALDEGSSPLFGGTSIVIHGETFTWDQAASYEDGGSLRYDIYTGATSGTTVTVTGQTSNTSVASASGSGVDGFLQSGSYGDMSQNYSETGTFNYNGHVFTQHDYSAIYNLDLMGGQLTSNGSETYSAANGSSYYYSWDDSTGSSTYSANLNGDSQSPNSASQFSLFGATYTWVSGTWTSYHSDDGTGYTIDTSGWMDSFTSPDGGTLYVSSSYDGYTYMSHTDISGWDPYAGSFYAGYDSSFTDLGQLTWSYRSSPSFAPAQLWVNGTLVNWTQGDIDSSGNATDYYQDSGGGSVNLSISGGVRDFALNGGSASVSGSAFGSYSLSGGFTDSTIQTSDPATQGWTDSTPFFTGTTSLWVNGTEYPFEQGYEDNSGSRSDTYVNESAGTVTLSGNTSNSSSADVVASYLGGTESGSYTGPDVFTMTTYTISTTAPVPPTVGPDAFWVRGRFYTRTAPETNTFQATADAGGGDAATLSLTDNGDGTLAISGTDATGTYSGNYSGSQGLFLLQDAQGAVLPAVPANVDGTLQLAGESAPTDLPPAVTVVDGRIWVYWGTETDDTLPAATAAYYGSALHADTSAWVLKLRLDGSGTVTYTDYITAASTTGSYSTTAHLFQTSAPGSGFPVPVYGVDPNDNHALWSLPQAPEGLPATFLVGGQVWRYTGTDENGTALYQGYYQGQQLSLDAADANGLRLVNVTDPVQGNTLGTLNDVRGSVRLRDGRMAYSGSFDGTQVNPTLNANNLQTIDADLDITGNVVTFGALSQSAATAGVTMQFADMQGTDTSYTASLFNILSRPQAQWQWARAADSSAQSTLPVMQLGTGGALTLFDPAGNGAISGVVLDPAEDGVSTIRGVLRVRPGGDISMGEFQEGGEP